ncbi:MAG: FAD-binding oxidoreductase [Parvularculaceae bacterium]|nr:FAD-binding oxidoreductase [Parvularculaceae bacterium]
MVNILYANDTPGEYPQSYYAATATMLAPFDALAGSQRADVCIIGGGYSGLSAALHLRARGFDVALLDAHRVGWGASGRNGGQIGTGQRVEQEALIKSVGSEHARQLWEISEDAKTLVHTLIEKHAIDCGYRSGVIHANHKPHWRDDTMRHVELLNREYGYDKIRYVDDHELHEMLATSSYFDGTFDTGAGYLHPLQYALGLARACDKAGVRIYEKSEVLEIVEGDPATIRTPGGELRANYIVIAANGYFGALHRKLSAHVMPINNYIIATEPLEERLAQSLIANNAAVADSKFVINYYRMSQDRRLLFGGRESYRYKFPGDIKSYVRASMLKIYPQLQDVRIDFGWGGTLGITMNRMPYFDRLAPNILTVGGYSGHGVSMATIAGAIAAETIGGVAERFEAMNKAPTPPIPGGAALRVPLLALGMAYYSVRDRM